MPQARRTRQRRPWSSAALLLIIATVLVLAVSDERTPSRVHAQIGHVSHETASEARDADYAGDAACAQCHVKQSVRFAGTAHRLASQMAEKSTVLGSFSSGSNMLAIATPASSSEDPRLSFVMDARPDGLYQTAVAELGGKRLTRTERIDIVFGSGVRGQTYLYWKGNQLLELPVSYWTDGHRWINSPGYADGTANFARHVDARCVECHASAIQALSNDPQANVYVRASLTPGIGCEVCHGPGAGHIRRERDKSTRGAGSSLPGILNPAKFDRDRQVDQCALCHNGTMRKELEPAFSYRPGQPLDRYLAPSPIDASDRPDVHGNQVGLLKRSRCYLDSPAMSCSTCHDVHAPERSAASYSPRCMSCHRWQSCGASRVLGEAITRNCVDCHMPVQQTDAIVSVTAGEVVRARIRTHWIKIYPGTEAHAKQ